MLQRLGFLSGAAATVTASVLQVTSYNEYSLVPSGNQTWQWNIYISYNSYNYIPYNSFNSMISPLFSQLQTPNYRRFSIAMFDYRSYYHQFANSWTGWTGFPAFFWICHVFCPRENKQSNKWLFFFVSEGVKISCPSCLKSMSHVSGHGFRCLGDRLAGRRSNASTRGGGVTFRHRRVDLVNIAATIR